MGFGLFPPYYPSISHISGYWDPTVYTTFFRAKGTWFGREILISMTSTEVWHLYTYSNRSIFLHLAGISSVIGWAHAQLHIGGWDAPTSLCCCLQDHLVQGHRRWDLGVESPNLQLFQLGQDHHQFFPGDRVVCLSVPEVILWAERDGNVAL